MDEFTSFGCPHCGEENRLGLDITAGAEQSFVVDCAVCCRPIVVEVAFDGRGAASVSAVAE
jgi:transcription elongation factor Elf1